MPITRTLSSLLVCCCVLTVPFVAGMFPPLPDPSSQRDPAMLTEVKVLMVCDSF